MARNPTRAVHAAVLVVVAALLILPLSRAGIAGFELDAADLARRIAVHRFGAEALRVPGDPAAAPTLGDLGMGELPFTSMALAFRALGLRAWVGRLPFALFGFLALAAVHALCARFSGRRAGVLAVGVLITCPLFALHARTMVGDGASIACFALAWTGLAGAQLEQARRPAAAWLALAMLGLVGGFASRGALLGVATPLCAAGLAGLATATLHPSHQRRARGVLALGALAAAGVAAAAFVLRAAPIAAARGDEVLRVVGMALPGAPTGEASFDRIVRQIGHAAFPWSAVAPFALGRLLAAPPAASTAPGAALRIHALAAAAVSLCAGTALVPWTGDLPWIGVSALAVVIALALDDLAHDVSPGAIGALVITVLGAVLTLDLVRTPERTLAAFSLAALTFPPGLGSRVTWWIVLGACGTLAPLALAIASPRTADHTADHTADEPGLRARMAAAREAAREVMAAWQGWLAFGLVVVEAALVGLAAMVLVGRWLDWATVLRLSRPTSRAFLHAFWVVPALCAAAPIAIGLAHAALSAAARALGATRVSVAFALATSSALAFSVGFHGEVAARMSPKEALEAFQARRGPGEPLGLVALSERLALFHGGGAVRAFDAPRDAFAWFSGEDGDRDVRRWLVVPARELPRLSSLHRARSGRNLPVAAATGEALLAVSDLRGAPSENPLDQVVLDVAPTPARPLRASFDDRVELLGWELRDRQGRVVDAISAGTPHRALFFVRSLGPLASTFRPFLHVERGKLRWNGDEVFVDHGYPSSLWHDGDVVVLECALELDANFGPGDYEVWFGFFTGGERLAITDGPASGDRVRMGTVRVR